MPRTVKLGSLSLLVVAPVLLSGCVVHERTVERPPPAVAVAAPAEPVEGYYDPERHRWYHEHVWVVCEDRDPHCPAP